MQEERWAASAIRSQRDQINPLRASPDVKPRRWFSKRNLKAASPLVSITLSLDHSPNHSLNHSFTHRHIIISPSSFFIDGGTNVVIPLVTFPASSWSSMQFLTVACTCWSPRKRAPPSCSPVSDPFIHSTLAITRASLSQRNIARKYEY